MIFDRVMNCRMVLPKAALILLLAASPGILITRAKAEAANTRLWDTQSPFIKKNDVRNRTGWKIVPTDLLTLEVDPAAAASDPSFWGREYSFKGDAVAENEHLIVVFASQTASVVVYSKANPEKKLAEVAPLQLKGARAKITGVGILQNTGDEAALEVTFSAGQTTGKLSAVFSFGVDRIIEIKPAPDMKGISILSPIAWAVVPNFIGDDLIFDPQKFPSTSTLHIPPANPFVGLLQGENTMLVMTWPRGKQKMRLIAGKVQRQQRLFESVDFDNDGKSIHLAVLEAPGIWHREQLKPSYLEKDIAVEWKKPFPAKWITQLDEAGVKTTFGFRESRGGIWRAITGKYIYPVWFDGESTFFHLSKKIPPKGDSLIYFLEREGTPVSVSTPVDIMKKTLGSQSCQTILDLAGRKLRTHHRRPDAGAHRAATCGCTAVIEPVFKAGQEVARQEFVEGAVDDMVYFVRRHVARIGEYQDFAREMIQFLNQAKKSNPGLEPYLDSLEAIAQQIPEEYDRQKENIKTLEYVDELTVKTKALTEKKDPKNLPTCLELGKKWRAMGGAQDYLLGKFHSLTRKLFQEAGYGCVNQPEAVAVAQEIQKRCTDCLRNPDSYEIWANY
ncbi:MAG: hypothetical protein J7M40_12355 [Planctomycetes bacterium]|nr:hypothetical protein [Planctomycetota bacterium]